jgi:hypothetical protein
MAIGDTFPIYGVHVDYTKFCQALTALVTLRASAERVLAQLPSEFGEFVVTNSYTDLIEQQKELALRLAFGAFWEDVSWFLYDWRPGFHISVPSDNGTSIKYVINNIDDYLDYAKKELFLK